MRNEFNPVTAARWAAALNLPSGAGTGYSISVSRKVFARGDPATTAANMIASETSVRLGIVAELAALIAFVAAVTNLASRLSDRALGGQILIAQRLYAEVEDDVEVEPIGELELKGFQRPVTAFNVIVMRRPAASFLATPGAE